MNRIKELRKQKGLTQEQLANKLDVDPHTISNWETGFRNPSTPRRKKLCKVFGCTESELFADYSATSSAPGHHLNEPSQKYSHQPFKIPILGIVPASDINFLHGEELDWLELDPKLLKGEKRENLFALKIKGNCLIDARIHDGDHIVVSKAAAVKNGNIAIVRVGDECTCKRVHLDGHKLILQRINKKDPKEFIIDAKKEDVEIIGKVIGCYNTNF